MSEFELDNTQALLNLPTRVLVLLANKMLNRMTFRDIGEICFELGLEPSLVVPEPPEPPVVTNNPDEDPAI